MPVTLQEQAVVGRRVEFAYYRDQDVYLPGIITELTDDPASLQVRLDGDRSTVACRPDYDGLRYLDKVLPVPDLPMGRFTPTAADFHGTTYASIPVCQFEDEDITLLTADPDIARAALAAFFNTMGHDPDYDRHDPARLQLAWVVFAWEPEDSDYPWFMNFAEEGDDMAIQIHYLPA